ncbi:carbohydrate ABC transporter permease [Halalkalicoccus tibetensis]|uniref:Carbohydrate ABC transporter permease n=1 Tax=Halalkalicoccus tibetensis TaxID=175632 RepID=A0ABD5VE54_9EURY
MSRRNQEYPGYGGTAYQLQRKLLVAFTILFGVFLILPLFWMVNGSLSTNATAREIIFSPSGFTFENYIRVFQEYPAERWLLNSIIVAVAVTLFNVVFDTLAGYSLARFDYRGREKLFLLFVSTMMVPTMVLLVPLYLIIANLGLTNTHLGLIIVFVANPFGIFLLRQHFKGMPASLGEAARMDGCNELQVFYKIYLPQAKSAVATLTIFVFLWTWNNFEWPLIIMQTSEMYTLPVALFALRGTYAVEWGSILAIALILVGPILLLFIFLQDYFEKGMTLSGMKG